MLREQDTMPPCDWAPRVVVWSEKTFVPLEVGAVQASDIAGIDQVLDARVRFVPWTEGDPSCWVWVIKNDFPAFFRALRENEPVRLRVGIEG